jgi:outer membrane protein OmpA-like peptidoglycan-associated protein
VSELAGINPDPGIDAEATLDQALKTIKKREAALTEERAGLQTRLERMQASMDSLRQEFNREQIRIAALVDEYQRDLQLRKENLDQTRRELGAEIRSKAALDMVGQARTQIAPGEAMVIREDKSVTLRLVGLEFATGQTAFSLRNRPMLDKLVQILAAYPSGKITIEGHTDATGREERNEEISRLRAEAVKEYLVSRNESLKDRMTVKGYGSSRPISSNDTPGAREANRRIDVIIVF